MRGGERKRKEGRTRKTAATPRLVFLRALMKLALPLALHQTLISPLSGVLSFMDHYGDLKIQDVLRVGPVERRYFLHLRASPALLPPI